MIRQFNSLVRSLLAFACVCATPALTTASDLLAIFEARGFDPDHIQLPKPGETFPTDQLEQIRFETFTKTELFPEGPSYRPSDDSYFFAGNLALTRVAPDGTPQQLLGKPGGGGTHFLPDGSVLLIGKTGLRRVFPDGRIALIADGETTGGGNDITIGKYQEIYFSVPSQGIYRVSPGEDGKVERVVKQGTNGLDVDPNGEFLYVFRKSVQRYRITDANAPLGKAETVFEFPAGEGGGDGCTFDAWGNVYTMKFSSGVIRVIDPNKGKLLAQIPTGVVPASNLTFGGPNNTDLFVTAGAPKHKNCQVLKAKTGITGFCGHVGAMKYPIIRFLDEKIDPAMFAPGD